MTSSDARGEMGKRTGEGSWDPNSRSGRESGFGRNAGTDSRIGMGSWGRAQGDVAWRRIGGVDYCRGINELKSGKRRGGRANSAGRWR